MRKRNFKQIIMGLIILIAVIFSLLPFFWIVSTSIKPPMEWNTMPPTWIPSQIYLENYREMWAKGGDRALVNTVGIGLISSLISLFIGSICGYSISRFKTGGNTLLFTILSIRLLPPAAIIIPIITLFALYRLIDTWLGLILIYILTSLPFTVYLMKTFFDGLPREIEEAAYIDGSSSISTLIRIALPLSAPGLVVAFLFALVFSWNELFFAVILTRSQAFTIPVKLVAWYNQNTGNWWGPQAAQAMISIIPILIIAIIVQKWMVKGLTFGAVKA